MVKEETGLWLCYSSINHLRMRADILPLKQYSNGHIVFAWALCSLWCLRESQLKDTAQALPFFNGFIIVWLDFGANCWILYNIHLKADVI